MPEAPAVRHGKSTRDAARVRCRQDTLPRSLGARADAEENAERDDQRPAAGRQISVLPKLGLVSVYQTTSEPGCICQARCQWTTSCFARSSLGTARNVDVAESGVSQFRTPWGGRTVGLKAQLRPIGGSSALSAVATARQHQPGWISLASVS